MGKEQSLTDITTQETPMAIENNQGYILVTNNNDGMSRRKSEYDSQKVGKLVVDPNQYGEKDIKRGDVIY